MGILKAAKPIAIVCTREREAAKPFYRDVLGLDLLSEDEYAAVFDISGTPLRLSTVPGFQPHDHTAFGFAVEDIEGCVEGLVAKGVKFNIYPGFGQNENGIWTAPGGDVRVAWFNDLDGNVLSLTQF